jgi:electron transfer flavoprotein alpha subunit
MTDVLAVAEHRRGELRAVSFETVGAAVELAAATGGAAHAMVVGGPATEFADALAREGVETVHAVEAGEEFNHDHAVRGIDVVADALAPGLVVMPHSAAGMDVAPAAASRLDRPLVTDAIGLDVDEDLVLTRELYASKVETTLGVRAERSAVTIRPGEWDHAAPGGDAAVETYEIETGDTHSTVTGYEEVAGGDVDITAADVLVSVGRGIDEEANLDIIHDLADALGATVSASRPVVDNGWLPPDRQVGQSGKTVSPDVYIAIGISGAVQHVAGIGDPGLVVAINEDPDAPIFDVADVGIVDDLFDVAPALTAAFADGM